MISTITTIQEKNAMALKDSGLAQIALDTINKNPRLEHCDNPALKTKGEIRWNSHIVAETYYGLVMLYGAECFNEFVANKEIPEKVQRFFEQAHNYLHHLYR
jgi:hypothetical protein